MPISRIKNLISKVSNRNRLDFIKMGLGIDARARRCYRYWKPHLDLTKEFQLRALDHASSKGRLAILGAGSLLDVDIAQLHRKFNTIELCDANPLAKNHWRSVIKELGKDRLTERVTDLTDSIDSWTRQLVNLLRSNLSYDLNELSNFINNLIPGSNKLLYDKYDVIFSLNLLSQIPIYWRDRVHQLVYRYWKIDTDDLGRYPIKLQGALEHSMAVLQRHHLESLSLSCAKLIVLVSDIEFFYYHRNVAEWQSEKAIHFDGAISLEGYEPIISDSWLWHIIPQGIEEVEYGSYHKVIARAFSTRPDSNPG